MWVTREKERDTEAGANIRLTRREIFGGITPDLLVCGVAVVFMLLGSNLAAGMHAIAFVFCFCLGTASGVLYSRRRP